jgi:hypothetical protein
MKKALQCIVAALIVSGGAQYATAREVEVEVETLGSSDLSVRFEANTILVTGATPGQQVVFLGITHETENYIGTIAGDEATVLADGSGKASWARSGGLSPRSLWFAIDVHSGTVAAVASREMSLRRRETAGSIVHRRDVFDALETPFFYAQFVLIRPGAGVWTHSASRGGSRDLKVRRGALTVDPRAFRTVSGAHAAPGSIRRGDVVISFDPYSLAFTAVRWEKQ